MKAEQKLDILQHIAIYMKITIRIIQQDVCMSKNLAQTFWKDDSDAFAKCVKGRQ